LVVNHLPLFIVVQDFLLVKKLLSLLFATIIANSFAAKPTENSINNSGINMTARNMAKMMYMNFGMGIGTTTHFTGSSFALDPMTMDIYVKKNLGVEIGWGMIPNGTFQGSSAMINTFHLATKGIFPLADAFSLYGKLGLGVSVGQGNITTQIPIGMDMTMPMMTMITPANVGPFYGVGMQFNLSKNFAIYVEDSGVLIIPCSSGFGNVNQTTLGLEVHI
jgi:opacity protein-like surface antigen